MQEKIQLTAVNTSMKKTFQKDSKILDVNNCADEAWQRIAPFWPVKNLIAANPLQGLENLAFEEALEKSAAYFQQAQLPEQMSNINRETIKWCQAFFDEGQATIGMPLRNLGLYQAWRKLIVFDKAINNLQSAHNEWLRNLPVSPQQAIIEALKKLKITTTKTTEFFILMLTTLPGWASYIKYRMEWNPDENSHLYPVTKFDYLAIRIVMAVILWPEAEKIFIWHANAKNHTSVVESYLQKIKNYEKNYQKHLLKFMSEQASALKEKTAQSDAQFVFCIDVRSEPFRRALEAQGNYQTFGFAGFFGIPVKIHNEFSGHSYNSCPVLLKPKHVVKEKMVCSSVDLLKDQARKENLNIIKRFYQSLKYTFTTPFVLVEALGFWSGLWMMLQTIMPRQSQIWKQQLLDQIRPPISIAPLLEHVDTINGIAFETQCDYAENVLRIIDLTESFANIVVFCGHGAETQNNAYASALDCGACGGNQGMGNARILTTILNDNKVKFELAKRGIKIPEKTKFIAAQHNTTTDEMILSYDEKCDLDIGRKLQKIKEDLTVAREINNRWRCEKMGLLHKNKSKNFFINYAKKRSNDWAQTRPEWGLARNAAFIIAPRSLTKNINLEGRCFLHSYNWEKDKAGASLKIILTAPMVVAQWINSQYLFSLLDNVAYGSGSKVTHNITGKIGVMQGNASDLMHGLPLQSIFINDNEPYHEPLRLMTVVYAPINLLDSIVSQEPVLQKLFGNGWVRLVCLEPSTNQLYFLNRNLIWEMTANKK